MSGIFEYMQYMKPIMIVYFLLLASIISTLAQDIPVKIPISGSSIPEMIDDKYIPVDRENMQTSKAYLYTSANITTVQVNVNASGENMLGDAANEPSITFDPANPGKMAIGWRQFDTVASNFRQAGFGYSMDGGFNWTFPGVIEAGVFRSDPVLDSDGSGNFFYNSLTLDSGFTVCHIFKSESQGADWDAGTFAWGGDKAWMSVDKTGGPGSGNIYNFWTGTNLCPPHQFSRSTDGNQSYEACSSIEGSPGWGTTAINAQGKLFVCGWQIGSDFLVARSSNAQNAGEAVEWDLIRQVSLDGEIIAFGGYNSPNPLGLLGQANLAIDSSGTETDGNIYLLCSVARYSNEDPCDLMFSRSSDEGETWSASLRLNDDPSDSAFQWFGTISVAPGGRIDVVWLDTRDHPGTLISELYYSFSMDGGISWSEDLSLSEPFDPHLGWPSQAKLGDYFDMFSDEAGVHLAWAATFNGEQDIYYSLISPASYVEDHDVHDDACLAQSHPNPCSQKTTIPYDVSSTGGITIELFNLHGKFIRTLVNSVHAPGKYKVELSTAGLMPGVYFYRLRSKHCNARRKLLIVK